MPVVIVSESQSLPEQFDSAGWMALRKYHSGPKRFLKLAGGLPVHPTPPDWLGMLVAFETKLASEYTSSPPCV